MERARLIDRSFLHAVTEATRPAFKAFLKRGFAEGLATTRDVALHQAKGGPVWLRLEALRAADGRTCRVVMTDITAQKMTERALQESEEEYRTLFQNAPIGIFRSSIEGRFLEVNSALAKMLGYDSPDTVIRTIHSVAEQIYVRSEDYPKIASSVWEGTGISHYVNRYRRKDGGEFTANLYVKTIRDAQGHPPFFEGIVEDLTEHQRLQRHLQEANAVLAKRATQLRELTSELAMAEQRERHRVASILHDSLQQILVAAKYRLSELHRIKNKPAQRLAAQTDDLIAQAIVCSRTLSGEICPPILEVGGSLPALEWLAAWMRTTHGLAVQLCPAGLP